MFKVGDIFKDRYQILELLGSGATSKVFKVTDLESSKFFALKVLNKSLIDCLSVRRQFKNELIASYKVNHPNLLKSYSYFEDEKSQVHLMEYIFAKTLRDLLLIKSLNLKNKFEILIQITQGVLALHKQDIIHTDLKPENIMINHEADVKIIDFSINSNVKLFATPTYLSPETLLNNKITKFSDQFVLGLIAFELITGKALVSEENLGVLTVNYLKNQALDISLLDAYLTRGQKKIFSKMLSVREEDRYQNLYHLIIDLNSVSTQQVVKIYTSDEFKDRHKVGIDILKKLLPF